MFHIIYKSRRKQIIFNIKVINIKLKTGIALYLPEILINVLQHKFDYKTANKNKLIH